MTTLYNKVAQPQFVFGTIRDWFEKFDSPNSKLDTAASNLHFYVQDHHKHTGDLKDEMLMLMMTMMMLKV